ncbi:hypothetical protein SESBI_23397 [Sesbania bispinosa]|nr:hypothetical protein SESBI_23397 [Sesbania bispinosa]
MEEPKASEATPQPTTPHIQTQTQIPSSTTSKKRPLDSDAHSNYFKIRAVIRDLRPHFIKVLQTPDYKNCKASEEIRELGCASADLHLARTLVPFDDTMSKISCSIRLELKVVIKLYDNMKADAVSLGKSKKMQDGQNMDQKTQQEQVKSSEQLEKPFARPSEIKLTPPVPGLQKLQAEDSQIHGTYVVGGSAFGWNFITFSGKEPVYYGRTKEQFRSAKVTE